jgi:CheY-like chemotaxis protein
MKTVLLVDDDNVFLLAVGVRLKALGYTVCTSKDAVSAVSAVRKNNPDIVVLDVSLPAGDGFLVVERLQKLPGVATAPIIIITASDDPELPQRAMKAGAVAFLKKPFDAETLANVIESAQSPAENCQPLAKAV